MRSKRTFTLAILTIAMLAHGGARSEATADTACDAAPTPECILDLAHSSADTIRNPATRARALTRIAVAEAAAGYRENSENSLAQAKLIADGTGLADGLPESEYGPRSDDAMRAMLYRDIIASRARGGASFAELTAAIDAVQDPEHRIMMSYVAAEALIEAGRIDVARPMIDHLLSAQEQDDNTERAAGLWQYAAMMYARIGDFDEALALALQMPDNDERMAKVATLVQIADSQRKDGDEAGAAATLATAEQTIPNIENAQMREMAGNMLASMQPDKGDSGESSAPDTGSCPADLSPYGVAVDKAKFGYFEEAVALAVALDDPKQRDRALSRIASLQSKEGRLDDAYNTALTIAESMKRGFAMREIADAHAKAGNADGAWMAAQAMPEDGERNRVLTMMINPLTAAGNPAGAARIARGIPDPGQRAEAYATLTESMLRAQADTGKTPAGQGEEPG